MDDPPTISYPCEFCEQAGCFLCSWSGFLDIELEDVDGAGDDSCPDDCD